ncbi:GNAT family N-acetyltransferase [Aliivibrio fischeri]|uniref:GNAT family N-acetyltransferase n=1 Tax=Aliivibrio fischeri TaxID=668 RepID=UPI0012D8976C|nr:GNAT family N-acetyltransferase [Aliivibrio fischeri]MUK63620.1 GNAT family N-acetyltransferase [Aliivibrio fischeri]MUL22477.1 GNAT family N-acetyltransferase [Aliivibrio fischeri]MUL26587.1 GNAT family N-acetyltransferase [Aliivibrio fischeri]
MIHWQKIPFTELTTSQLYELLRLRVDVFVVEQTCPYPELDGKDCQDGVHHLIGTKDNEIIACARLLPAGTSYINVSIGRVATKGTARGDGLGHELLSQALACCEELWPGESIDIGAQEHLTHFYQKHGFEVISDMYLEDDIPHVDMRLEK